MLPAEKRHDVARTVLGIRKFRTSTLACFPKEIVRIIARLVSNPPVTQEEIDTVTKLYLQYDMILADAQTTLERYLVALGSLQSRPGKRSWFTAICPLGRMCNNNCTFVHSFVSKIELESREQQLHQFWPLFFEAVPTRHNIDAFKAFLLMCTLSLCSLDMLKKDLETIENSLVLCRHWASGNCRRGNACCFGHPKVPCAQPVFAYKTKTCIFWSNGYCVHGDLCTYRHGRQ